MTSSVSGLKDLVGHATHNGSRLWLLIVIAGGCFFVSLMTRLQEVQIAASVGGGTLLCLAFALCVAADLGRRSRARLASQFGHLVRQDAAPCFVADSVGQIQSQNLSAQAKFGDRDGATLVAALGDHFASPSAVLYRLQNRAEQHGAAREDVVTRRGHTRLSVHRLIEDQFLWRLEEFLDRGTAGRAADTLSLPMLTANKSGVVLFTNEAMRRLLGGRPKRLDRIFTQSVLRSGEEVEVYAAAGPVRAVLAEIEGGSERREIYLLPVQAGTPSAAVMADFEHVPVALMKFMPDGGLIAANRGARDLLQMPQGPATMFHDLFEGLGRPVCDWLADVVAERVPGGAEVLRLRTQTETFLQITLRRIVEAGRPAILAVLQDATALKTLEAQFVQSQKMQAIGQLAGGVAHDFNNLLTAISGHCDLLMMRHDRENPNYSDLVQIHQNANRAAGLVRQLLAFSRKQTLQPERIEVQEVLSDVAHLLNRLVGEKVQLKLTHAPGLGAIRADKRQLEQVLLNLVVNARDAMPSGGTIRIDSVAVTLAEEFRRDRAVVPPGDYAVIRVSDTGVGIPDDRLQKIFEPFYTTKKVGEGTGLGLSTAYGIIKQSGGFIFVDSVLGEGSLFQVYFPIHDVPAEKAPAPKRVVMKQGEGVVLLVEDEAPVRAFASRALRMRGYTVIEAENAEAALKTLEDPGLEVDIFVTDVVMPGMDGPSWVRQALETRPNVRVIFVSGYAEDYLSETQARVPNSVFLAKPFSLTELTATVQGQMH